MNPLLVTMRGPGEIDIASLSNFEAGIAALSLVGRALPGLTFGDLARMNDGRMSGSLWDGLKSVGSAIGDTVSNIVDKAGSVMGSAVRLVTDEKVIDGASRLGQAYATSGGSEGVRSMFGGGAEGNQVVDFVSQIGEFFKGVTGSSGQTQVASAGAANVTPWLLGGGLALVLVLLVARK